MMSSNKGKKQYFTNFFASIKRQRKVKQEELNQLLLESIDEVLVTLFGKQPAKILKSYLNLVFSFKNDEPFDPQRFSETLEKLLGAGASFIEVEIIRKFISKYTY